jgi:hypothetical protein
MKYRATTESKLAKTDSAAVQSRSAVFDRGVLPKAQISGIWKVDPPRRNANSGDADWTHLSGSRMWDTNINGQCPPFKIQVI